MNVYLDNNATTPLHPEAVKAITEFLGAFGNPSSMHAHGRTARQYLDDAAENIAAFFGAPRTDLLFTSGASESNNMVMKSFLSRQYSFKPHLIISAIEHPSVLETAHYLQKNGFDLSLAPVTPDGVIDMEVFRTLIRPETVLVSVMWANNEIGTIQPIGEIAAITREKGIHFHVDAVQAAGKMQFRLDEQEFDTASFAAHKMYAPKGIGLLYVRDLPKNGKKLTPLIHGGHQAGGLRAGTENTIGIVGFGAACKAMLNAQAEEIRQAKELRDHFERRVLAEIPDIIINGYNAPRKPCTSNITFKYIEGEAILLRLDLYGISVSTGSACSTGSLDPSHVIMALSSDPERAHGSIRFSFGRENTLEEADYTVEKLKETVEFLRSISPLYPGATA